MQKVCTGVRMVKINRGLSWIVFDILKSCWQTAFHVLVEHCPRLYVEA